jgi:hypothetical protein
MLVALQRIKKQKSNQEIGSLMSFTTNLHLKWVYSFWQQKRHFIGYYVTKKNRLQLQRTKKKFILIFYFVTNDRFQLQRTRSVDVGCDHGHADILRLGLRVREERGGHQVHLHATGEAFIISTSY